MRNLPIVLVNGFDTSNRADKIEKKKERKLYEAFNMATKFQCNKSRSGNIM